MSWTRVPGDAFMLAYQDEHGYWLYCDESESLELFADEAASRNEPDMDGSVAGQIAVWEVSSSAAAKEIHRHYVEGEQQ